jgi:hypothetical protein
VLKLCLVIWSLEHFSQILRRDGRAGNLKCEVVRRQLSIDLAVMSRGERSAKLLEHATLASRVFRILMDGARVVKVTPAVSTIWCFGSIFDLDLALHVVKR